MVMMSLLPLLILSILNIVVDTFYIPTTRVIGEINIKNILKGNLITRDNLSSEDYMNITQLASKHGYVVEEHEVTTADGYILAVHRLAAGNNTKTGIPVLLMHGLLDSSDSWILQGPGNAVGYLLVDEGFDVWMGNARGNKHSSAHKELKPNQEKFWTFSWEEIGVYDLPAMIDYVLHATGKENLYYVGHSQGTTSFLVMSSLKPDYGIKIKMMFALSPVAWLSHAESPVLKYLSTVPAALLTFFQFSNTLTPSADFLHHVYGSMCKVVSEGCGSVFEMLFGHNYFVSDALLPTIVEHASSASVLQFVHYWQLYESGRFCRFDYGWMRNLLEYGTFSPPDYHLGDIGVPIILFFSNNDRLSHPSDVAKLHSALPRVCASYYSQYFSHIDYMYACVAKDVVYNKIINHIQDYEHNVT